MSKIHDGMKELRDRIRAVYAANGHEISDEKITEYVIAIFEGTVMEPMVCNTLAELLDLPREVPETWRQSLEDDDEEDEK